MSRITLYLLGSALLSLLVDAGPARAERCGPNDCGPGTTCCNYGCGICTAPDEACILLLCQWGRPLWIDAEHVPSVDRFDRLAGAVSIANYTSEPRAGQGSSSSASSTRLRLDHRAAKDLGVHARLTASTVFDQGALVEETFGYSVGAGALYLLPNPLERFFGWAVNVEGEFRDGPILGEGLGPAFPTERPVGSAAAGLSFGDRANAVPLTAYARYIHSLRDGAPNLGLLDAGASLSTRLGRYLFWFGGEPVPFGLRVHYRFSEELTEGSFRAHEIGGGAYYFALGNELRVGIDVDASFQRLAPALDGRKLLVLARADWYWDANF